MKMALYLPVIQTERSALSGCFAPKFWPTKVAAALLIVTVIGLTQIGCTQNQRKDFWHRVLHGGEGLEQEEKIESVSLITDHSHWKEGTLIRTPVEGMANGRMTFHAADLGQVHFVVHDHGSEHPVVTIPAERINKMIIMPALIHVYHLDGALHLQMVAKSVTTNAYVLYKDEEVEALSKDETYLKHMGTYHWLGQRGLVQ